MIFVIDEEVTITTLFLNSLKMKKKKLLPDVKPNRFGTGFSGSGKSFENLKDFGPTFQGRQQDRPPRFRTGVNVIKLSMAVSYEFSY